MTILMQIAMGAALLAAGIVKIVSHIGAGAVLTIQMCSGRSVAFPVGREVGLLESAHCWGCYAALAGLVLIGFAAYQAWQRRRAIHAD